MELVTGNWELVIGCLLVSLGRTGAWKLGTGLVGSGGFIFTSVPKGPGGGVAGGAFLFGKLLGRLVGKLGGKTPKTPLAGGLMLDVGGWPAGPVLIGGLIGLGPAGLLGGVALDPGIENFGSSAMRN